MNLKINTFEDFFYCLKNLQEEILELRLITLPQIYLIMLFEREKELRKVLCLSSKKIFIRKQYGKTKKIQPILTETENSLKLLSSFFQMLKILRIKINTDLRFVENQISYNTFKPFLKDCKYKLRKLSSKLEKEKKTLSLEHFIAQNQEEYLAVLELVNNLKHNYSKIKLATAENLEKYYNIFDKIFTRIETDSLLKLVSIELKAAFKAKAYNEITGSYFFNKSSYSQKINQGNNPASDYIKKYLDQNSEIPFIPSLSFNNNFYLNSYPEVKKLRYNPLEHFLRYGETFLYNPCRVFDSYYYLKSNDDVLDAGIAVFKHYIAHGNREGRPPSPDSTEYFYNYYSEPKIQKNIKIAIINNNQATQKNIWSDIFKNYKTQEELAQEDIIVEHLDLQEIETSSNIFDVCFIYAETLKLIDYSKLTKIMANNAKLIYLGDNPESDITAFFKQNLFPLTDFLAITNNYKNFIRYQENEIPILLHYYPFSDIQDSFFLKALLKKLKTNTEFTCRKIIRQTTSKPIISVVSIIYKKSKELCAFLESLNRQNIACPYEVILVDDASPDKTTAEIKTWLENKKQENCLNKYMSVKILSNTVNMGNCFSRNKGIEEAKADIVLVADGDVVFNSTCLSEHCLAYRFEDCDAVIAFFNYNLNYEVIFNWLAVCELDSSLLLNLVKKNTCLLGTYNIYCARDNIYNFVTRNVSFKKTALNGDFFDLDFGYSSNPLSGYGEEDHELAARLYFNNKKIRFITNAFSLHIRHDDNSYNTDKNLSNLRNWNKLIAKHPELIFIDRQYYQARTLDFLQKTASRADSSEFIQANSIYSNPNRVNIVINPLKKKNILTYKGQVPYLYELFKLYHNFTLITNNTTAKSTYWDYEQRPLPYNVDFKKLEDINLADYDFAVLPFHENILRPELANTALSLDWGETFKNMLELTKKIPCLAIFHGIHQGDYPDISDDFMENNIKNREEIRELVKDITVVCNSYQAEKEWNFYKSSVIWRGFSPLEYPKGKHFKNCLTLPQADFETKHTCKDKIFLDRVIEILGNKDLVEYIACPEVHPDYEQNSQEWATAKFQNHTRYLGDYAVYLNPSPNFATLDYSFEAMLTGTVPVSLRSCDTELFIKNGFNGFYAETAEEMAEQILWIMQNEKQRKVLSENARLTALDIFNIDRFLASWNDLLVKFRVF